MGTGKSSYALSVYKGGETFLRAPVYIKNNYVYPFKEYSLILEGLIDALTSEVKQGDTLIYYSNNDLVTFDYESEYLKEGKFSQNVKCQTLWKKVTDILKYKKVNLIIKGENSMLSLYGKIQALKGGN